MKAVVVLMGLVLVARPVCAEWERTAGLETNATPSLALAGYRLVTGEVSSMPAAGGTAPVAGDVPGILEVGSGLCRAPVADGVGGFLVAAAGSVVKAHDLPGAASVLGWDLRGLCVPMLAYEVFTADQAVTADAGGFGCLAGAGSLNTGHVVAFQAAGLAANHEVDPFLSLVDVWDGGTLGGLRRSANTLRARGDQAAFGEAAAVYWRAMNAATARRDVFGGRGVRRRAPAAE